jgi:hypothetical protein
MKKVIIVFVSGLVLGLIGPYIFKKAKDYFNDPSRNGYQFYVTVPTCGPQPDQVLLNGIYKGKVKNVTLTKIDNRIQCCLKLKVAKAALIPIDSKIDIQEQNIIEGKSAIFIELGKENKYIKQNDTLPCHFQPGFFETVLNRSISSFNKIDSIFNLINKFNQSNCQNKAKKDK